MMNKVRVGEYNLLPVAKKVDFGVYLTAGEDLEILLPQKYVPENTEIGDKLKVFIYTDSEDRLIATTLSPIATAKQFACLEVKDTAPFGAFMEMGVEKHILVPLSEQPEPMKVGHKYVVYIYLDESTTRLVASARLHRFLKKERLEVEEGQSVQVLVANRSELGWNVVVDNEYMGLLYYSEVFQPLAAGDLLTGYVKKIRPDNKLDISLRPQGFKQVIDSDTQKVLDALKKNQGVLMLSDKSSPEAIYELLHLSKKAFKKAIGGLYKSKKIHIHPDRIEQILPKNPPQKNKNK